MTGEANIERRGWGLPASVAVHALVAALVIFGLPETLSQPQEEEVVSVTLEPPPKPPEPAKAEPPPPEPAKPPEPAPEQAAAAPIPPLNPVVKFGEKDAGPRRSLAGAGAEDNPAPRPPVANERKAADAASAENPEQDEKQPAAEKDEGKEPGKADDNTGSAAEQQLTTTAATPDKAPVPAGPPPGQAKAASEPKLHEARTLFSRSATGGPAATTAMANIPRGVRIGRLCETELGLQLLNGGHFPDLLPSYRLEEGTVLAIQRSAYRRAGGVWHDLSFECQVDADATGVVSFAFRVGDPIPRAEAARLGLPLQ
jgi:hypothetical protein